MKEPIINTLDSRALPLNVGGFMINVLKSNEASKGFEIFHMAGPEGKGPGPHFHPWDEAFYVLQGKVKCGVNDVETIATQGDFIYVPANTTHWFKFMESGGEMISMTSHGNASKMFQAFENEVNWESPNKSELVKLAAKFGQIVF